MELNATVLNPEKNRVTVIVETELIFRQNKICNTVNMVRILCGPTFSHIPGCLFLPGLPHNLPMTPIPQFIRHSITNRLYSFL